MIRWTVAAAVVLGWVAVGWGAPVPIDGQGPVPVEKMRVGNPAVLPMMGTWRFKLEHGKSPSVKGELPANLDAHDGDFAKADFDDSGWSDIAVPGNWEIAGFSRPTFQTPDDDIGLYRRWVEAPAGLANRKVLWHFGGVFDGAEVFVNGERGGEVGGRGTGPFGRGFGNRW